MFSVNQLTVTFNGTDLFNDVTFLVQARDRVGLVGKNGAGKSTLLKIFAGLQEPAVGSVTVPSDMTVGYLPQVRTPTAGETADNALSIIDETRRAFDRILALQREMEEVNTAIAQRTDYESDDYMQLIHRLTEIHERIDILGGNAIDADVERILLGLGFEASEFNRKITELSGGWRMRIELAKVLLRRPNLLLLDEPTNHLDIESIQWLESFLKDFQGAVVLVSHDRAFLDNVTTRTVEISLGKIYDYKAPYTQYLELRREFREQQMAAFRNQQKMIADTEAFIERFRYKATKAVQVQSRIKQLDKVERIEIDEEDNAAIHIRFPAAPRSGTVVVETTALHKQYGDKVILESVDFKIQRGEKVAFAGRNGEGKSTLSKIIIGELPYEAGEVKIGHNVKIGYYAQNQDEIMDGELTVFQTIDNVAVGDIRPKIRDLLGAFLFRGEDIDKKVKVLSGGERSRLAMVKMLLEPYNLLLLDEPTNHLDIRSKDILKQALLKYDGTLIVVSHDRDFLDGLVDKVYEFRHKQVREYIGGIYDFLQKRQIESLQELEKKTSPQVPPKAAPPQPSPKAPPQPSPKGRESEASPASSTKGRAGEGPIGLSYQEKKDFDRQVRKLAAQVANAEAQVERLEREMEMTEQLLSAPEHIDADEIASLSARYQQLQNELEQAMNAWTQASEAHECLTLEAKS